MCILFPLPLYVLFSWLNVQHSATHLLKCKGVWDFDVQGWCSSMGVITDNVLSVEEDKLSRAEMDHSSGKCIHPFKFQGQFLQKTFPYSASLAGYMTSIYASPHCIHSAVKGFPRVFCPSFPLHCMFFECRCIICFKVSASITMWNICPHQ